MKIQPVSFNTQVYSCHAHSKTCQNQQSKHDSVSFTCYSNAITQGVHKVFKHESEAEKCFNMLIEKLLEDPKVYASQELSEIVKLYKSRGMVGVLTELWRPVSHNDTLRKLIDKAETNEKNITLAYTDNGAVLELANWGRNGFWNSLTDNKNATRDIRIVFNYPNSPASMEYGFDKKGRLNLWQYKHRGAVFTKFHKTTGHRMQQTFHSKTSNPEVYYYHANGSKNHLKNWIQGGTIIPSMW